MDSYTLDQLLAWADWAGYNRYNETLKNVLQALHDRGIQLESNDIIEERLNFIGLDRMVTVGEDLDLIGSLAILMDLRRMFGDRCNTADTSEFQFLRMHHLIIVQACISYLYVQLGIPVGETPPEDPRSIHLPASFSLSRYFDDVYKVFEENKIYGNKTQLGKIEEEYAKNAQRILIDIFDVDENRKLPKEHVLNCLHYLLHQHSFSEFTSRITSFSRKVEVQALPPPIMKPQDIVSFSASSKIGTVKSSEWTEDKREKMGPYASPAATSPHKDESRKSISSIKKSPAEKKSNVAVVHDDQFSAIKTRSKTRLTDDQVRDVTTNLRETSKSFRSLNQAKDPLLGALDPLGNDTQKRVRSVVGREAKASSISERKGSSEKISSDEDELLPHRKKRILEDSKRLSTSRATSMTVDFSEDEDEDVESKINEKRQQLALQNKKFTKFPKKLELNPASPAQNSNQEVDAIHSNFNRVRWTSDEEDALLEGVEKYGTSAWANIRDDPELKHRFNCRTNMNLKDKFRNLQRKGVVDN